MVIRMKGGEYGAESGAAKQDSPGAMVVYEDLKPHFAGGKKSGGGRDSGTEAE